MEKKIDPGYKQLVVHIDPEMLKDLKRRAINLNTTLKNWVLQACLEKIKREDKAQ